MDGSQGFGYAPLHEGSIALNQTSLPPPTYQPSSANVVVVQPNAASCVSSTTTTVVTQQPVLKRPWGSKLCDCFEDMHSCCCTLFCGGSFLACLAQRMNEHCCVGCCLPGLWPMRSAFRERHQIEGDLCNDFCVISFCGPCAICQMSREMDKLGYPKQC